MTPAEERIAKQGEAVGKSSKRT